MSDYNDSHEYYAPDEHEAFQGEFEAEMDKIPARLFARRIMLQENAKKAVNVLHAINAFAKLGVFDTDHPEVMQAVNYWHENPEGVKLEQVSFADAINQLRDEFGMGMYDAKQVLARANGDLLIAQIALRNGWSAFIEAEKSFSHMKKQAERITVLESENTELKNKLEQGAKLRAGLYEALENWFAAFYENGLVNLQSEDALKVASDELFHILEKAQNAGAVKSQLEQSAGQHFGYGIVDKNGSPYPEMYTNKSYAIEEAERFTETYEDKAPYRVVELRWVEVQP